MGSDDNAERVLGHNTGSNPQRHSDLYSLAGDTRRIAFAQPFDSASLELRGSPITVAEQLLIDGVSSLAALSASPSDAIAYRSGPPGERQLMWFDRSGRLYGLTSLRVFVVCRRS